jgi:hypothetical protein
MLLLLLVLYAAAGQGVGEDIVVSLTTCFADVRSAVLLLLSCWLRVTLQHSR